MLKIKAIKMSEDNNLLIIAAMPYYAEKGSSLRLHLMIEKYIDSGYNVDVCCYNIGEDVQRKKLNIIRAGNYSKKKMPIGLSIIKFLYFLPLLFASFKAVKRNKYSMLQGEDIEGAFICFLLNKIKKIPYIYDLHNPLKENLKINSLPIPAFIVMPIEKALYRNAMKVISNWRIWKSYLENHGARNVDVVHDEISRAEEYVNINYKKYITYSGNFKKYQGVELLVKSFISTLEHHDYTLMLIGSGSNEDKLKKYTANKKAENRIVFLGTLNVEKTNYILRRSQYNILPRTHGKQPSTKLIHYINAGKPIIASEVEANKELHVYKNEIHFFKPKIEDLTKVFMEVLI
jgi:glycosyltransferase involved in cell wall biosynthesis